MTTTLKLSRVCEARDIHRRAGVDEFTDERLSLAAQQIERTREYRGNFFHALLMGKARLHPEQRPIHAAQVRIERAPVAEDGAAAGEIPEETNLPLQQPLAGHFFAARRLLECGRHHR